MTRITPMPAAQLPPHITPTLPPTESTRPSGLIVVRNEVTPITASTKLVVPSSPLVGNAPLDAAKAAYAELAAAAGAPAAEILLGGSLETVQRVRNEELRQQAIAAFLAGDAARAAQLIAQAG